MIRLTVYNRWTVKSVMRMHIDRFCDDSDVPLQAVRIVTFSMRAKVIANPSDTYCETSKDIREGGVDMRIEAYTQVQQLYQSQKVSRTQKTQTASHTDRLQISSQGKDFQTAKAAVAAAPDIREELTAPIKARIQNGTYGVDNASFAEKLLQKQEEMR